MMKRYEILDLRDSLSAEPIIVNANSIEDVLQIAFPDEIVIKDNNGNSDDIYIKVPCNTPHGMRYRTYGCKSIGKKSDEE